MIENQGQGQGLRLGTDWRPY